MKKQILFFILLLVYSLVNGQGTEIIYDTVSVPEPTLIDDSPVGLGVLIGDNQNYLKGRHPEILISKPTVVKTEIKPNGLFHIIAYVNNDYINIIATRINSNNFKSFQAYEQVYFTEEIPAFNENFAREIPFIVAENGNPTFLRVNNINNDKVDGRNYLYFVKDIKTGEIVSTLALEFIFPKPEPMFLSFEEYIIDTYETKQGESPSINAGFIADLNRQVKAYNLVTTTFNARTNLPNQLILPSDQNSLLIQFKALKFGAINYLEYRMNGDSTYKTSVKNYHPFIILKDLKAGKHKLQVRYPNQHNAILEYEFEVKPSFMQTTGFKIAISCLATALLFGSIFTLKIHRQKQKLKEENTKRTQLQTQMFSLRSQLNPHFVFNALNSIQGLVNKDDQEGANIYISKFGSLMRDILEKNDKATHPLSQEIKQLESYLQLEQLRFRFKYQIFIEETINPTEQDFPVMLLQPFAENAIKHGISGKKEEGNISIRFERSNNNLLVIIQDNGKGFDINEPITGYGINLIKERIAVVNQLYQEQPIMCDYKSSPADGTTVTLLFTNWL
ncbi:histidine kinase [Pontibacter sp. 172403-2]|uniref:sensor histidine kinase n=1 Tax=Pontibacter rufus TaxID=2791028 RepID=UPI0018AF9728|nr:histidine kinase [Pontibacter sp. 172403-2]MBF9255622.1 histidine kinase [Pontibacter sp. 172403-2]